MVVVLTYFECERCLINKTWLISFPVVLPCRSSGPSGHSSSSSGRLPAWRSAGLQRCLGRVLPAAGCLLWHSQPSDDGRSTPSLSGTPPLRICPPYPLEYWVCFLRALTQFPPAGLQGSSGWSSFTNLTKSVSSLHRILAFNFGKSPLFLLLTCNVSSMYFLLHRASNVKWT